MVLRSGFSLFVVLLTGTMSEASNFFSVSFGFEVIDSDWDDDGISNDREIEKGTDPYDPMSPMVSGRDFDYDGLEDSLEIRYGWDPLSWASPVRTLDSDGFGGTDYEEVLAGTDPHNPLDPWIDEDADGVPAFEDRDDNDCRVPWIDEDGDWVHALDDLNDADRSVPYVRPCCPEVFVELQQVHLEIPMAPGLNYGIFWSTDGKKWNYIWTDASVDTVEKKRVVLSQVLVPSDGVLLIKVQRYTHEV